MSHTIAVLNAGSSSLKFAVFIEEDCELELLLDGQMEGLFTRPHFVARRNGEVIEEKIWPESTKLTHEDAIAFLFKWGSEGQLQGRTITSVGHRVVHGGLEFGEPVRVDPEVIEKLEKLIPLAPLHQPYNLAAIKAVAAHRPGLPQVACFDTSYHRTNSAVTETFALPRAYTLEGVRRYGFHGLSYEYITSVLPRFDPKAAAGKIIVAHLGNGASMCAIKGGKSIANTMGFTAADGLPMGTRCGAIDPGVLIYLMDRYGLDARALEQLIYKESGLLGISGISSDMRVLLDSSEAAAAEAVDVFVYRVSREMGSLAAALEGLDGIVFTGGIGENSALIRDRICRRASWLGLDFDEEANKRGGPRISRAGSRVSGWVIPTDEDLMIARHTQAVLGC